MSRASNILRTALGTGVTAVILVCVAASSGVSSAKRNMTLCTGLDITVLDSTKNVFVTSEDVKEYLQKEYGSVADVPVRNLDLKKIESILDSQSAILKSEAWCTGDGVLHIDITQRKPLIRFQQNGSRFYADDRGYIFPLKSGRSSYVLVVDGELPLKLDSAGKGRATEGAEKLWLEKITELVNYMNGHKVWSENIVQIHVQKDGDLILVPREGQERFLFGKPDDIQAKFLRMEKYYTAIVPVKGQEHYKRVDVRYEDQIICK